MKIKIRYENQVTTIDGPNEDCAVTIQTDYEMRLAIATDKAAVEPRTMQEIMDELNHDDYNSWHRFNRHQDKLGLQKRLDGKRTYCISPDDRDGDEIESYADCSDEENRAKREDYEAVCQFIRSTLKPANAELVIAVVLDGMTVRAYAQMIGEDENNVSHRLKYSEKLLKKSSHKFSDFGLSRGYLL